MYLVPGRSSPAGGREMHAAAPPFPLSTQWPIQRCQRGLGMLSQQPGQTLRPQGFRLCPLHRLQEGGNREPKAAWGEEALHQPTSSSRLLTPKRRDRLHQDCTAPGAEGLCREDAAR